MGELLYLCQSVEPEQPFAEPWHAELFAVTHALAATGAFTWREWTERLRLRWKKRTPMEGHGVAARPTMKSG